MCLQEFEYDDKAKYLKISGEVLGATMPEQLSAGFRALNFFAVFSHLCEFNFQLQKSKFVYQK
jgi:hypothetical protein